MGTTSDPYEIRSTLPSSDTDYWSLPRLAEKTGADLSRFPYTVKVLLESVVRQLDGDLIRKHHVEELLRWKKPDPEADPIPFMPARVVMQDFTGVPAVVDLAVMRDALADLGGDPSKINPSIPVDLVIDHSVQVDQFGSERALPFNAKMEFKRNRERYEFLRWGSESFSGFRVVPPATGIVHQVNLEYLAKVVMQGETDGRRIAYPDTLVGTDSHTTMINGIGVLGWGVGGIEAEAVMLGQPYSMPIPEVIGVRLSGSLREGVTATDLVLTITEMLRKYGVVGKFVEFFGTGLADLRVQDRATISNMSPEFGTTASVFPVDEQTLGYLRSTGRTDEEVDLVEHYAKEQGLFRTAASPDPEYTDVLDLDLGTVEPSIAGPKRPHDRIPLRTAKESFLDLVESKKQKDSAVRVTVNNQDVSISNGSVIIAAITSCTNTSNPSVMIAAGLVAKRAVELGLHVPAYVKTSLAPGSRVVTRYLQGAGLMPYLEALGFHLVGYGCTTCIGNSGPLDPNIVKAIEDHDLVVASVLSGNRNFEGRIHPESRANYLASPPLVVAYALAGSMNVNLSEDAIGSDPAGTPVFLRDVWPSAKDVADAMDRAIGPELFREEYAHVFTGNETWNQVRVTQSSRYEWQPTSTYIRKPTFFDGLTPDVPETKPIEGARVLAYLGDSVTTDHISPAGTIPRESPASRWLTEHGVKLADFNTFGSRRGNHEVMIRGTFGNIRIKNRLVPGIEGGYTKHLPSGEDLPIFDAAARYAENDTPLLVLAGKEYGSGSSRDWAAKGTVLLNVRAVLAESYERIHRSNLIGMGVLPLQFAESDTAESLGLDGTEEFSIETVERPQQSVQVVAKGADGSEKRFTALARIDTDVELRYYRNGGILHTVLRDMVRRG